MDIVRNVIDLTRDYRDVYSLLLDLKRLLESEWTSRESPRGLVRLPGGRYYAVGDIHGDFDTLARILYDHGLYDHLARGGRAVFLGDYIDRGYRQVEVFVTVALLKLEFRESMVVLRGNHEGPEHLLPYPHDYPYVLGARYGPHGRELYDLSREIFGLMPYAAYREGSLLFVHGGVPVFSTQSCPRDSIGCVLDADDPYSRTLEEILWNDPLRHDPDIDYEPSPRGAGLLWGLRITRMFLEKTGLRGVVRGHEPSWSGYILDHEDRVLTLFSRKGDPYYNAYAAIARLGNIDEFRGFRQDMIVTL